MQMTPHTKTPLCLAACVAVLLAGHADVATAQTRPPETRIAPNECLTLASRIEPALQRTAKSAKSAEGRKNAAEVQRRAIANGLEEADRRYGLADVLKCLAGQ